MVAVHTAGVPNEHSLLLNSVAVLTMGCTRVNGVLVVQAPAHGVALDDLITHGGCGLLGDVLLGLIENVCENEDLTEDRQSQTV